MYNCNYYCLTVLLVLLQLDLWAAKRGKLKHHHEIYLISTKRITTPHKTKEINSNKNKNVLLEVFITRIYINKVTFGFTKCYYKHS